MSLVSQDRTVLLIHYFETQSRSDTKLLANEELPLAERIQGTNQMA